MKSKLFLFLFIVAAELICAQTELTPGYIIKLSGAILQGDIELKTDTSMESVCNFHIAGKDTTYHYFPNEITGYGITDGDQYASKQLNGVHVFMKRVVIKQMPITCIIRIKQGFIIIPKNRKISY